MPTYFLIDDGKTMPSWCELAVDDDGVKQWVDFKGRRQPFAEGRPLAHVEGENIYVTLTGVPETVAELERSFAFSRLLDPWSDQGWISPDGKFWGCRFYAHDDLAYALMRKSPATLEDLGWVRVHADSFRAGSMSRNITRRQQDTLSALGFADVEPGGWGGRKFEIDRDAPPPRYAVKPPADGMPKPEPKITAMPSVEESLGHLVQKLSSYDDLAGRFNIDAERIPDVGPGTWMWMLRWDDIDIGGEDHPAELSAAAGLHLRATSFNTVEIAPWPFDEIRIDPEALRLVEGRRQFTA